MIKEPARYLEALLARAAAAVAEPDPTADLGLPELEEACHRLAADAARRAPLEAPSIGFDKPANIYVVTELYDAGGHRVLLEQMIAARPHERHIVIFSGTYTRNLAYGIGRMREVGAFPVYPEPELSTYDHYRWLRARLGGYAAQRVFLFHHPEDVSAVAAAVEIAPRYGRRLYMVRHTDTCPTLGALLSGATHLAIRSEQFVRIRAETPGHACYTIPLSSRVDAAQPRIVGGAGTGTGTITTATAGGAHKFQNEGPLHFGRIVAAIIHGSRGRHLHFGWASHEMQRDAFAALEAEGLQKDRLIFVGKVPSIAEALRTNGVDLFFVSFPIGGGLTASEAASAGVPLAIYDPKAADESDPAPAEADRQAAFRRYRAGVGHHPPKVLLWSSAEQLFRRLRLEIDDIALAEMARSAIDWHNRHLTRARFVRRFNAILAVTEGRGLMTSAARYAAMRAAFDAAFYLDRNPDVALAGMDPWLHFCNYGNTEGRSPCALFDRAHYLEQLPEVERRVAQCAPFAHYIARGEGRGFKPHPLFDPVLVRLARGLGPAESPLVAYLSDPGLTRPHTLFDPRHYLRQAPIADGSDGNPLLHFLAEGAAARRSPHPMVDLGRFGEKPRGAFLEYLTKDEPAAHEPAPHVLFSPEHFARAGIARLRGAAPNLLWTHIVAGNRANDDPHPLVNIAHALASVPEAAVSARPVLAEMLEGRFVGDTHRLVNSAHILRQAPWLPAMGMHPTLYFVQSGVAHNIDPHPYFSTQFYNFRNPDVMASDFNPLVHYLLFGEFEARSPHRFFDGNYYYHTYLSGRTGDAGSPLLHYVTEGCGIWNRVQRGETQVDVLATAMAARLLKLGDTEGAAEMLREATHSSRLPVHPTLACSAHPLAVTLVDAAPAAVSSVRVTRPSIVYGGHLAPVSGDYTVADPQVAYLEEATVVGGNDGVLLCDGTWFDPALEGFDPAQMRLRERGAVVSVSDDLTHVVVPVPEAIFASATYSHNYFHFLLETLPRIRSAERQAPPGVPILADDHMPAQHFQILRLLFPERPVQRLVRGLSYRVGRLHVATPSNRIADVVDLLDAPVDAARYHPETLRWLNSLGAELDSGRTDPGRRGRKLFLQRASDVRRMVNAAEIEAALSERGFQTLRCDQLSFVEQIRAIREADVIVAQSGAHLANIVFARPGTRVIALYSDAPCTNYYLWDGIGCALDLQVTNVVGWRVGGSAGPGIATVHEDFTLPPGLLLPLVEDHASDRPSGRSKPALPADLRGCLDALYSANAEADTITAAWSVLAEPTPAAFEQRLVALRDRAGALIEMAEAGALAEMLEHPFFADFGRNIRSGFVTLAGHGPDETARMARVRDIFAAQAWQPETPPPPVPAANRPEPKPAPSATKRSVAQDALIARALALAMLCFAPRALPLLRDVASHSDTIRDRYLGWLTAPPFLFRAGEDAEHVAWLARMLDWANAQFPESLPAVLTDVDLGQLFLVDAPVRPVLEARNRLLARVALLPATPIRARPRATDGRDGRLRVGVLCRTFEKGPDSEAVVSIFRSFDRDRFEIYAYSPGFRDRVVRDDRAFAAEFDAAIDHRRLLRSHARDIRETLLADDLDVFLHANATTYGLRAQEIALWHRVAPVQLALNSHVPLAPGFPSFDGYVTGRSDDPAVEADDADLPERLIRCDGPVICYLHSLRARFTPLFERADLGLADDDIVLMNAGSLSKLRHDCLRTMMRAAAAVPGARLILAPYNPGWVARSQAFAFNRQLAEMAEETGLPRERLLVLGELSVAEAESALALADIYLNPFPHGGATMTHLALINGKPPVTLRRQDTRSIDQFLVATAGASDLLVNSPEAYVDCVRRLAANRAALAERSARLRRQAGGVDGAPLAFVDNPAYSRMMQDVIKAALAAARSTGEDA